MQFASALRSARAADREQSGPGIALTGEPPLLELARGALAAGGSAAMLQAELDDADAVVYAGTDLEALRRIAQARGERPFAVLVPASEVEATWRIPGVPAMAVVSDPRRLPEALGRALAGRNADLAQALPALRYGWSEGTVGRAALQAGAIALLKRGSHSPALTAIQAGMTVRVAAAHGAQTGQALLPELAAGLFAGEALRNASRSLTPGRVPRAALAAAGTAALGRAAMARFAGWRPRYPARR